ncbi:hypothetical protein DFH08DRAFT_818616 [Mycena albidolilacea]|uniref:Uncharacterized protein n=1 Tax=Mycena albidolilacea TaxID=1033008 RepID=A0AAD7EH43_9AGAR|nr:hypothetical protein DFH08DRAFT_818616 [Mycena albidolilacea]
MTTKAIRAAAITKAEGEEAPDEKPAKKKHSCPPENKAAPELSTPAPSSEPKPAEEDVDYEEGIKLTWKLIMAIEEGNKIRASLFLPVGANKLSSGKKKSEYQYQLAKILFTVHLKFKEAFAQATTVKEKKPWYLKIKHHIDTTSSLIKKARAHAAKDLIKKDSPWFFHAILGWGVSQPGAHRPWERQDRDTDDSSSLAPDDTADLPGQLTCSLSATVINLDDGSDSNLPLAPILKQPFAINSSKSLDTKPPLKKTHLQLAISRPAEGKTAITKPVTVKDKFGAAVLAEEETAQECLRHKQAKNTGHKEVQLEKLRLQAEAKLEKNKAQLEILQMKMVQEHKYHLAQLHTGPSQPQAGPSWHSGAYTGHSQSQFREYTSLGSGGGSLGFDFSSDALDSFDLWFGYSYGDSSVE